MYLIAVDHITYEPRDGRPGFGLDEALRELRGTRNARILRLDGTPVVVNAGSDMAVTYAPTGRVVRRRRVRRFTR